MSVALLVITDGRLDYLRETIASARANLLISGLVSEMWMYDDTGDYEHRVALCEEFDDFRHINAGPRQGFGGAIRAAWNHLAKDSAARFVFHLEQDFIFNRPVQLAAMAYTLDENPDLVQLALRRQPWNPAEVAAGGVVEQRPDAYVEMHNKAGTWLEHRLFMTTNPSLYRRSLCSVGWPKGLRSEGRFAFDLLRDHPTYRFGYWGARDSGEAVAHIGYERAGVGY